MWTIQSENLSIKINHRTLLQNLNLSVQTSEVLMLLGPNGVGKSTFIRCLNGQLRPDAGKISWKKDLIDIPTNQWYQYFSHAAPGIELYPDLTIQEWLKIYFSFKKSNLSFAEIKQIFQLDSHWNVQLKSLSSGWLDRVKLASALVTNAPVLFLDEPTSHLDNQTAALALDWIEQFRQHKIVIWASNLNREFERYPNHFILGE